MITLLFWGTCLLLPELTAALPRPLPSSRAAAADPLAAIPLYPACRQAHQCYMAPRSSLPPALGACLSPGPAQGMFLNFPLTSPQEPLLPEPRPPLSWPYSPLWTRLEKMCWEVHFVETVPTWRGLYFGLINAVWV